MSYFLDQMVKNISIACHMAASDPYVSRSIMKNMLDKEKPKDPEIVYIIEKMIFISLDSPLRFRKLGIDLISILNNRNLDKKNKKKNKK